MADPGKSPERPAGPLVWIHTGAALPPGPAINLATRIHRSDLQAGVLLTSCSEEDFPNRVNGIPYRALTSDRVGQVRGFLDRWRPDVGIWTECDLRPTLLGESAGRGIPLILADTGTGRPDLGAWRWRIRNSRGLASRFGHLLAGDAAYAEDLRRLGADPARIEVIGLLEEGPATLPALENELDQLSGEIAARPIWLALGVAPGAETDAVLAAHRRGLQRAHRLLLVLVPDPADTARDLARQLASEGWTVAFRGAGDLPVPDAQIYVADSLEERGLWFRLAPISFLGRTIENGIGINPLEAAGLGSAILHGPNTRPFGLEYARLSGVGATRLVKSAEDLVAALEDLLAPDTAAAMAEAAWQVTSAGADVTDRIIELATTALEDKGLA